MGIIYKPRGKAQEYAESAPGKNDGLAINLFSGCRHGCRYCFVPLIPPWKMMEHGRAKFHERIRPRKDLLKLLERDCKRRAESTQPIHLCFTCDPYCSLENGKVNPLVREVLLLLETYRMKNVQILTKAINGASRDFDIIKRNGWMLGSTITFIREESRNRWEGRAPSIADRMLGIQGAHDYGIFTWLSVEPVIYPAEALAVIEELLPYVDLWKVGKINHGEEIGPDVAKLERDTDWADFRERVTQLLDGREYLLKKSLLNWEGATS